MSNKTNKVKWTAKLKALIISVSLAFAVALGGAGAAIGLSLSDNNKLGGSWAGGVAGEITLPDIPINEDMVHDITSADQWAEVIAEDSAADGYAVAKLTKNITAASGSFGTAENAYLNGALNVPAGKYIVLDLNGYTVNRGLTEAVEGGSVITNSGNLVIKDSSAKGKGKITGGYTTGNGGGIRAVAGSTLTILGGTISGNKSTIEVTQSGGGGIYAMEGTVNIAGGTITGNTSQWCGGGLCVDTSTVTLSGGTISNNVTAYNGGGIYAANSTITMTAGTISGNKSQNTNNFGGGGIFSTGVGTLTISGGTISNNTASYSGGGIYTSIDAKLTMTGGTISNNTASVDGGGVYIAATKEDADPVIKIKNAVITGNKANGTNYTLGNLPNTANGGGGVYIGEHRTVELENNNISNNSVCAFGGGIFVMNATVTMNGGSINNNEVTQTSGGGGGVTNYYQSSFTINGGEICDNFSVAGGAGVFNHGSTLVMNSGKISGNSTINYGGGGVGNSGCIVDGTFYRSVFTMNDGEISDNTAGNYDGGAVHSHKATFNFFGGTIKNNTTAAFGAVFVQTTEAELVVGKPDSDVVPKFIGNTAGVNGGAIYCSGIVTINKAIFENNKSFSHGGAICQATGTLELSNCTFEGNNASGVGGCVYIAGKAKVSDCTFTGNKASDGATLYFTNNNTNEQSMKNITITGNSASKYGGGMTAGIGTKIALDGKIDVSGNTIGNGTASNVLFSYRGTDFHVAEGGSITAGSKMGFHLSGVDYTDTTKNVFFTGAKPATVTFSSDSEYYSVSTTGTQSQLVLKSTVNTDNATRWNAAVAESISKYSATNTNPDHNQVVFELLSNWTADANNYKFGAEGSGIDSNGSIVVPKNANIVLNLYQFAIDRGVTGTNRLGTLMLDVKGTLTIIGDGYISGSKCLHYGTAPISVTGTLNMYGGNIRNNSGGAGGAINIYGGTFNMYSGVISGNAAESGLYEGKTVGGTGGAICMSHGTFNMYGGTISGNTAATNGGAIYAGGGTVNIYGGTIGGTAANAGNTAKNGGGIYEESGATVNIGKKEGNVLSGDAFIVGNHATSSVSADLCYGGGIYAIGTLNLYGGTIKGNDCKTGGGGVAASISCTFNMEGGIISGNTATQWGGGAFVSNTSTMTMTGGQIKDNTCVKSHGGGICLDGTLNMTGGEISGNTSKNNGGGVYAMKIFNMSGGEISGNTATGSGGGVYTEGGTLNISGGEICGNTAVRGGGLYTMNVAFTISGNTEIYGNKVVKDVNGVGGYGAAMYINATNASTKNLESVISGGKIYNNTAASSSAGLLVGNSSPTYKYVLKISGGEIYGNTTVGSSGGVTVERGAEVQLSGTAKIYNNTSGANGGGVQIVNSDANVVAGKLIMTGGQIYGNTAVNGGGVYINGSDASFNMYGGMISGNEASDKGGGVYNAGTFTMTDGEISGNTSIYGSIYIAASSQFEMNGGEISNNTSVCGAGVYALGTVVINDGEIIKNYSTSEEDQAGGGAICVGNGSVVTLYGGLIEGNESKYGGGIWVNGTFNLGTATKASNAVISGNFANYGGGVYVFNGSTNSTFNMYGGEISDNTATGHCGGVYVRKTFNMYGGTISGNTAEDRGGAVYVDNNATMNMSDGTISGNNAQRGSVFVITGGTFTMSGGEISDNTTLYGGGVFVNGGTFSISGGEISCNTATTNGGVYMSNGTLNVSGKPVISGNTSNGKASNVYLLNGNKITVAAALTTDAKIGVSTDSTAYPVTITSGFGSKSGTAALAGNVFKADKEGEVAVFENNEVVIKEGYVLTVKDKAGNKLGSISVVAGKTVNGAFNETTRAYTLTQSDAAANKLSIVFDTETVPVGYAAYMYDESDPYKTEITSISLSENKSVILDKKALTKNYTIKYILQSVDGSYNETAFVSATRSGLTDTAVVVMNESGKPFATIQNAEQYTLDTSYANGKGVKVAGDGSTVVLVYLQLNEYTVTYNANGGTPSKQTKKFKFGETLSAPTRIPTKKMATFAGWVDAEGNTVLELDEDGNFIASSVTVSANMTLTAKYSVTTYRIEFDMNIDGEDDEYTLNTEYALSFTADDVTSEGTFGYVSWASDKLFDASKNFNYGATSDANVFAIDYTIENVPYTMSIRNVRPTAIGYTFAGWYLNGGSTRVETINAPTGNTDPENALVYKARWTPTSYTVFFDRQDGTWNSVSDGQADNCSDLEDLLAQGDSSDRGGYRFAGWYLTPSTDDGTTHITIRQACERTDGLFSIAALGGWYQVDDGANYDFSKLTLYAEWVSEDVFVSRTGDNNSYLSYYVTHNDCEDEDGNPYSNRTISVGVNNGVAQAALNDPDNSMHIGDLITITPRAATGYKFDHMIIHGSNGDVELGSGVTEFKLVTSYVTDFEANGKTYKVVHVSAAYTEDRYTITYDLNGGRLSGSASYTRSYSPSELTEGHKNRAKLPNNLVREGYTFLGWVFDNTTTNAFVAESGVDTTQSMYGKVMYLAAPMVDNKPAYDNLTLKAKWDAQVATVNLYNATYGTTDYDNIEGVEDGYVIKETTGHKALVTDMVIEIINPARTSYDFLGWATSRNGAVLYPAVEGKTTVSYTVSADHDVNGKPLNQNNLYAVWHIKGVDRIIMTVDNNESTYGGDGITMTAKTEQVYVAQSGSTIQITYNWYRILDGMYDACFTEGKVFVNEVNGKSTVTGYEFDGTYYRADGKTVQATKPAGEEFPYRRFDESRALAANYCELKKTETKLQGEASSLKINNVSDCGTYICAVTVTGVENSGGTTTAGGYGEIEISMKKAVYGNLVLRSAEVTYNSEAQWNAVMLGVVKTDNKLTLPQNASDGLLKLPDDSKLVVTYRYFIEEDGERVEITNRNDICNVGTYYVTVEFAWAAGGNKGNYVDLDAMEAELVIKPFEIEDIVFTFIHGDDDTIAQTFSGVYDGTAYSVIAAINDTFGDDVDGEYVVGKDDVKLNVTVNAVNENGVDVPFTGETIDAGVYSIVISRELFGSDAGNFVLKSGTLRQEYTIAKSAYDVEGNIRFADATFEFNNFDRKIEVEFLNGKTKPETVTPTYTLVDYDPESSSFSYSPIGNVGKYAGVYTIRVDFVDSNSKNYRTLESMTATMTITKANLFEYFASKPEGAVDLLTDAGFVGRTFKFDPDLEEKGGYKPTVKAGSKLADTSIYKITYAYYPVEDGVRGNALPAGKGFFEAGRYEIVANIEYVSALYKNNFEEVQENESTIVYVIDDVEVESVTVYFTEAFENSGKPAKLGATFDYGWIKQIDVVYAYENDNGETVRSTRRINQEDDIKLAQIRYESRADGTAATSFWKVGAFKAYVGVYGSECEVTVNVKQEIDVTDSEVFQIEYNDGGTEWKTVGEDGINGIELKNATYQFRVVYGCIDTDGETTVNRSDAAHTALKLGSNKLTVNEENSNYIFVGDIAVKMYKVITSEQAEFKWQYSENDGATWKDFDEDDFSLVYRGSKYRIRVSFKDDSVPQACEAHSDDNETVLNYREGGYVMHVGLVGNYLLRESDVYCTVDVTPSVLEVTWDKANLTYTYNGLHQSPTGTINNLAAVDKGLITLEYRLFEYDEEAADNNYKGSQTSAAHVTKAGKYVIEAMMLAASADVDKSVLDNYTFVGSKSAVKTFTIAKANVGVSVIYSEYNYGTNVTYAGNVQGLREDALQETFSGEVVKGKTWFVSGQNEDGEPIIVEGNSETVKNLLKEATTNNQFVKISYAFIPEETENYNVTYGQIDMTVKAQSRRKGTGSLFIDMSGAKVKNYIVDQTFNTEGIKVYGYYESYYTEGKEWYGYRGAAINNPNFRIDGKTANGYKIYKENISGGMITLTATSSTDSGTVEIPVEEKQPVKLEISSKGYKTEFYVGEKYDFSDLEFKVTYDDESIQEGLTKGSIECDYDNVTFTTAGEVEITFTYFDAPCTLNVTVKAKEDLQISEFSKYELMLIWKNGEVIEVPKLKFTIDGVECTNYEGIKVTYRFLTAGVTEIKNKGEYPIEYTIEVTNPRFNTPTKKTYTFEVIDKQYLVEAETPTNLTGVYTDAGIQLPELASLKVTDAKSGNDVTATADVLYYINGKEVHKATDWTQLNVGSYVVRVVIEIGGETTEVTYEFTITQATDNALTVTAPEFVVLKDGVNFEFPISAKYKYDKDQITYEYSTSRDGVYSTDVPTKAGIWYVRVTLAGNDNYNGDTKTVRFEVRAQGATATVGDGSIEGENGVGSDWTLEIRQMESEAVGQVSVSKQNVLDGYEVVVKEGNVVIKNVDSEYTVRIKLTDELKGQKGLNVYFVDADGKVTKLNSKVEGEYVAIKMSNFDGRVIITKAQPKQSVGPLVAVIVLGVVAAGAIAACVVVFILKKKKRSAE